MTPYAERIIVLTLTLGTGTFGATGSSTLTMGDPTNAENCLRSLVQIENAPTPHPGRAIVTVYGLTLDQINQATIAGILYDGRQNKISIQAGDAQAGVTTIYNGIVWQAYPKANQPEMPFIMMANPAFIAQLKPVTPTSFKGPMDGATILGQLAGQMGVTLENNSGVTAILSNPYFAGTTWDQIKAITEAMNCYSTLDAAAGVLAIWPKNGNRGGSNIPMISPQTGMIDYPEFQAANIKVRTEFDPGAIYTPGHQIQVQSQFTAASGLWTAHKFDVNISCRMPDGPWESAITAYRAVQGAQ